MDDATAIHPTYIVDTTNKYDPEYDKDNPLGKQLVKRMLQGAPDYKKAPFDVEIEHWKKRAEAFEKRAETAEEELRVLRERLQPFKYEFTMNNTLISVMVRPRTCEVIPLTQA